MNVSSSASRPGIIRRSAITAVPMRGRASFFSDNVLDNDGSLGKHLPVVEQQGGQIVVGTSFCFFVGEVYLFLQGEEENCAVEVTLSVIGRQEEYPQGIAGKGVSP
ncbi:MAG: hypothetical protein ACYDCW_16505 [Acidithiobacillus ferrivorans]